MTSSCFGRVLFLALLAGASSAAVMVPAAGVAASSSAAAEPAAPAPAATPGSAAASAPAEMSLAMRLSPSQYRQSIADIFDPSIQITGSFEPETRVKGLLAIGERQSNVSDSGLESYDEIARGIAEQVVDPQRRATFIGCTPQSPTSNDDACTRSFFARVGPMVYRRPLTDDELQMQVAEAAKATAKLHDYYGGVAVSLSEMLVSPDFLFRYKLYEPDPAHAGQERLTAYSKATELSYFLWNSTPDEELLSSAASGAIQTPAGLAREVNRLIASPRIVGGVRAFFSDMLGFADFDTVSKDPTFFPRYTLNVKNDTQEQTLRTIVDHLVNRHGDYRDLFTTPRTFLTRELAILYGLPLVDPGDNGEPQRWIAYTYPAGDPRAGLLSQASFTAQFSPSGRTSPTGRGKALREYILCERVPPPPGNVSFKFVEDISNPAFKTARARLTVHRTEPMCAGCHKLTDPIGLALENFNSAGAYRTEENGVPIDASGEINGHQFNGPQGLAQVVHDDPATTNCVASKAFAFETGYMPPSGDAQWQQITQKFAASRYNFVELMRQIALSALSYSEPSSSSVLTASNQ
jgi:hypothetical protein